MTFKGFVNKRSAKGAKVYYTDETTAYHGLPNHETINTALESTSTVRPAPTALSPSGPCSSAATMGHSNPLSAKHLNRYVQEFAGRHNIRDLDTLEQMFVLARGFVGKRLKYADLVASVATPLLETGSDAFQGDPHELACIPAE